MTMKTIILFDPYPIVGLGFTQMLRAGNVHAKSIVVSSIEALAATARSESPDMLILTVNTPKHREPMPLLESCQKIFPSIPVVLYDEEHYPSYLEKWLKSGVSGYVLKGESSAVLLQCIDVVLGGGKYLSPAGWNRYLAPIREGASRRPTKLGVKEYEVARFLSEGKSTSWIAHTMERKPSTISTMKKRIYSKLQVSNIIDLSRKLPSVINASGSGLSRNLNAMMNGGEQSLVGALTESA